MTAIGRFALKSETINNPSIPTFFLALSDKIDKNTDSLTNNNSSSDSSSLSIEELESTWKSKKIFEKHPRFSYCISKDPKNDYFFHPRTHNGTSKLVSLDVKDYIKESILHYAIPRDELRYKIQSLLIKPLDISNQGLWEGVLSTGTLGSSGAIPASIVKQIKQQNSKKKAKDLKETVILFRAHHAMADGVSLANVITDLSDESEMINDSIAKQMMSIKKKKKQLSFWERMLMRLYKVINFWFIGSIKALLYHGLLLLTSNSIYNNDNTATSESSRSVSWCNAASVDEIKQIIKILSPGSTINDVFVSCVSAAILQQMKENNIIKSNVKQVPLPHTMNVVIPVHLTGGIIPPGESMGNRIGAMVVRIPGENATNDAALDRLSNVSKSIKTLKSTPSAFLSYYLAKFFSSISSSDNNTITQKIIQYSNANAICVISNVRAPTFPLHIQNKQIHSLVGFLPLPAGVPIGVVIQSYNGMLSLSVTTSDKDIIPDPDRFLKLVLMEYGKLYMEAKEKQLKLVGEQKSI